MADNDIFPRAFEELTGQPPMSWQTRLYEAWFSQGRFPCVIDIPTGLGKTMVMAIWLIARARLGGEVPTRLVYVVDRRTVVDQATDLAQWLVQRPLTKRMHDAFSGKPPAISTLRGQLADNRVWSRDPSRPAIIIGTVDLIGSALLFSGYRSSYKRRPLEAGLLGQDSLLVLDEAHLSRPFEKLLKSIHKFQDTNEQPMHVIRMSATSNECNPEPFGLIDSDFSDPVIDQRFNAKKRLTIKPAVDSKKLNDALANAAIDLAEKLESVGKRIVVFVRRPDDATKIAETIRKHGNTKSQPGPFVESVEVLTGTMRGLERDDLVEKPVLKRFLNGDEVPGENNAPVFLISTSAGEVGFDLNADHMVCDATTIDSLIQRLGRVNRRGEGDATVILVSEKAPKDKTDLDKACIAATKLLKDGMDLCPKNIAALKNGDWKDKYADACSPEPTTVDLTDILLDAWSMTSITPPMPGRPEVGPWLRGIADELPQTTITWRAELDEPGFTDLGLSNIEEWFDTHRILAHETLSVPTSSKSEGSAEKWLIARWEQLGKTLGETEQRRIGARHVVIDRSGVSVVPLADLIGELNRGNTSSIRYANLILPASFGGIERGMLHAAAPTMLHDENSDDMQTRQTDVADVRDRYREKLDKPEDGETTITPLVLNSPKPKNLSKYSRFSIELDADDDRTVKLVSYVRKNERLETGQKPQTLKSHIGAVRKAMDSILSRLSLPEVIKQAARLAADWHDHGKNREGWQRLLVFPKDFVKPDEPMGKSGGEMKRDSRGYRHEFGSLRELADAFNAGKLLDDAGNPISHQVFDLAMHLIATHHGRGRPHFPKGGFDPNDDSRSEEIHAEAIRRFARLQREYGRWRLAWLENLLRCADAMASADPDAKHDPADSEGDAS